MDGATDSAVNTPPRTGAAAGELAAPAAPNVLDAGVRLEGAGLYGTLSGGPISERREEAAPVGVGGPVIPPRGGDLKTGGLAPDEPANEGAQALALELPEVLDSGVALVPPGFALASARAAVRALRVRASRAFWTRLFSRPISMSAWNFISKASSSGISRILFALGFGIADAKN